MPPPPILDDRKWISIAFLAISDQYATLISIAFLAISDQYATFFFSQNGCRWPFWITENHFWSHFWPFQINTQFLFGICSQNGCRRPFWMTENHFRSHFSPIQINTQLWFFFTIWLPADILDDFRWLSMTFLAIQICFKMAASGHFGIPICAKNNRVLPLCVINGYAKYEVDRWIYDTETPQASWVFVYKMAARGNFPDWCQKS